MKTLMESAHIRYVEVTEELLRDYLDMVNDIEHVARWIGKRTEPLTEERESAFVHRKLAEKAQLFSMVEKDGGAFIGNIELMDVRDVEAELGIAITAEKQDLGYGRESIAAVLAYARRELGLRRVFLKVYPENLRAIHVYERCGFREYQRTEEDVFMEISLAQAEVRELPALDPCAELIRELNRDPLCSDPRFTSPESVARKLQETVERPNEHVWGVFDGEALTGLFVFLVLEEERYIEMLVGLTRSAAACEELAGYLAASYAGFQADFIFNPANAPLRELLRRKGASFYEEQQKMVLSRIVPSIDTEGIVPLSPPYREQYLALHDRDCYWTGDRVAEAADRFSVFLAIEDGTVVGYIDVTNCFEENEPYALWVAEARRRRGWGRKLLARAIEANRPHGMMLLVDVDNRPAISLYESMGFETAPGQNSQTATWNIN